MNRTRRWSDSCGIKPLCVSTQPSLIDFSNSDIWFFRTFYHLISWRGSNPVLAQLMGSTFVFHHLHSDRRSPGSTEKAWHHDYEQNPQVDRTYSMIHTMHYLSGLDESMGGLVVLPGSHREVAEKTARAHLGTAELPGEVLIARLPPGSTVLLHSALFHARRPSSAGPGKLRYMIDSSYCDGGVRWPTVKPYWTDGRGSGKAAPFGGPTARPDEPDLLCQARLAEQVAGDSAVPQYPCHRHRRLRKNAGQGWPDPPRRVASHARVGTAQPASRR